MRQQGPSAGAAGAHNQGFSLVELLITVAIIAVIISTIASLALAESNSQTARTEAQMIERVAQDLRLIFTREDSFLGSTLSTTTELNLWPANRITAPNTVVSAWGPNIQYAIAPFDATNKTVRFTINGVPLEGCVEFATYPYSASRVLVNGTQVFNITGVGPTINPIDVATTADRCAATTPANVVIFFSKDNV